MDCCKQTKNSCSYLDVTFQNDTEEILTLSVYDLQGIGSQISPQILQPLTSFSKTFEQNDDAISSLIWDGVSDILSIASLIIEPSALGLISADLAMLQTFKDAVDWNSLNGAGCFGNIFYTKKDTNTGECKTYISYFSCIQNYCFTSEGEINTFFTNFYWYDGKGSAEVLTEFNTKDICKLSGSQGNSSGCVTLKIVNKNEMCQTGFTWNDGLSFCNPNKGCWDELLNSKIKYVDDSSKGWYSPYSFNKFIDCQNKSNNGICYQGLKGASDDYFKLKPCQYNCPKLYKNQDICDPSLIGVNCFSDNAPGICQEGLCPVKQSDGTYRCSEKKQDTICGSLTSCTPIKYTGDLQKGVGKNIGRYIPINRYSMLSSAGKDCLNDEYCQGVVKDNVLGNISTAKRIFMDDDPNNPTKRYTLFLKK